MFIATETDEIKFRLNDAPLHKRIDQNIHFLGCDETVCFGRFQRQNLLVQKQHILERRRQFHMQPRFIDHLLDFAQCKHDRILSLINDKQGRRHNHQYDGCRNQI